MRNNGAAPSPLAPQMPVEFPAQAWPPGLFLDYHLAMATGEAPSCHHFAACLGVVGALLGRLVYVDYDRHTYPNFYIVLVGRTGAVRKTSTMRRSTDLLADVDETLPIQNAVGSAEGLAETLATAGMIPTERRLYDAHVTGSKVDATGHPDPKGEVPDLPIAPLEGRRLLLMLEEWATLLGKARQEGTGNLIPLITNLYDCPNRIDHTLRSKSILALAPTLSIITASAPVWVERFLTTSELLSGFCNRFSFWPGEPRGPVSWPKAPNTNARNKVVKELHDIAECWAGRRTEFTLTEEAHRCWASYYAMFRSRTAAYDEQRAAVIQRVPTFAVKMALVFAATECAAPEIRPEHIERATMIADYLEYGAGDLLGGLGTSPEVELERKILKRLADGETLKRRALHQAVGGRYGGEMFMRCVQGMLKAGMVEVDPGTGGYFDPSTRPVQEASVDHVDAC